ncbi:DUF2796 domain-containing protein [Thiothrix subterranea]|uniref:DUF2796 domain-containing protein n=1 Tax=Thiothrix subterranea TaxID=2735563 RepID=A0AA51MPG5_9GAMM|nr:DUF2796 domain-containing protein [Thiothrix subterranea]MDQ5770778.1 DUF2796 domain-containing protein [Thiothrix subterranea]WML87660.1 DUF2796 domain-containing protein [Thiothrix subterranea]
MKYPSILFSLCLALSSGTLYADDHEHEHEAHGAHEHGAATLSLAVGTEGLEIMLESPAANIVGFEHAATTDADKQKLADTVKKLEAGAELFSTNTEAGCTLKNAEVVSALLGNTEDAAKHDHDHEKSGETHNNMDVTWSFACTQPAELKEVAVKLFAAFPDGFQHIKAEWVTEKGASAVELDKDDTIKLTP